jgi:serine/threonine protein kinase
MILDESVVPVDSGDRKQGLRGWLKDRLTGKEKPMTSVDEKRLAALAELDTIGRYEIINKLGQGSMGMVFLGKDPYIKRHVAIKVSRPSHELPADKAEEYRKRFFTEAQSAGRLAHPNIVAIYDAGLHQDFCYITMEYIDGPTLERSCRTENLLPIGKVVETVFTSCMALDYAHKRGVIHRDIKPSNIMLNRFGVVKITDFGIAHIEADPTFQKGIVGSPSYMSPEQVREEPVGERSDIFALGCVFYELLTGKKAFSGDNDFSILYKIVNEPPVPIREIRRDVPEVLSRIAQKALTKDAADRYQTCLDFAYDLRVALRGLKGVVKKSKVEDVTDYVNKVPFFEDFTPQQVQEILMASNLIKVRKGKVVVNEGEIDDSFFIILSGEAVVRKNDRDLAKIKRGECFGEMSYLSGRSRAATVMALSDCILMKISATLLDRSSESIQLQFLKRFAATLLTRLSKSNQDKS